MEESGNCRNYSDKNIKIPDVARIQEWNKFSTERIQFWEAEKRKTIGIKISAWLNWETRGKAEENAPVMTQIIINTKTEETRAN